MIPSIRLTALALGLLLAGCTLGPDHVRPEITTGDRFLRQEIGATSPAADEAAFWQRFEDPMLTALVGDALRANHDLRIGLARLDQARALSRQSRFDLFPTVTAEAGASESRASADQAPGASRADRDTQSSDAAALLSWELDLFGRVRRGVQAQRADSDAVAADLAALQVSVVAELAQAYFELRGRQAQLAVARGNAENQRSSSDLVATWFEAGRGTELDTARASAQLESTLASIPALEAEVAAHMHRIAVLTGRSPEALVVQLEAAQPLPVLLDPVAASAPAELLRRRPDIAAAEHRLEAATVRIGVATADLFPRFTLGGLIGSQASSGGDLFGRDSETRVVALGVDWTFLDVGRVRARLAAAEAGADESLARYQQTVLRALEETETALVRYQHARSERAHLEAAAAASARGAELARRRFEGGLVDFLQVLDAERTRLDAEDRLAQSQARTATALVAVYRALAGGWPETLPEREHVASTD